MSGGAVKLRAVFAWMAVMLVTASLLLAQVWKQQAFVRLSRELLQAGRDRDALATEVLVLETETRALGQLSRLETFARERLGLINPGPPTVIQPEGQLLALGSGNPENSDKSVKAEEAADGLQSASFEFWKGWFR